MKGERHALCVQVEQDRSTLAVVDSFVQAEIIALDNSDPVARIKLSNTIGCNPWVARALQVWLLMNLAGSAASFALGFAWCTGSDSTRPLILALNIQPRLLTARPGELEVRSDLG